MKNLFRSALVSCALLLVAACAGTGSKSSSGQAAVNGKCPVTGEELPNDYCTTMFQGSTVGFCCEKCIPKWNGMSDADKQAKLKTAMPMK